LAPAFSRPTSLRRVPSLDHRVQRRGILGQLPPALLLLLGLGALDGLLQLR